MGLNTNGMQARIYTMLVNANVAGGRVYDDVPPIINTGAGPYIEIGPGISSNDDASLSDGIEFTLTLNIWSEWKGLKQANDVADEIRRTLHRQVFSIGNMGVIMWMDDYQSMRAADGVTRQGVIRIRCACRT